MNVPRLNSHQVIDTLLSRIETNAPFGILFLTIVIFILPVLLTLFDATTLIYAGSFFVAGMISASIVRHRQRQWRHDASRYHGYRAIIAIHVHSALAMGVIGTALTLTGQQAIIAILNAPTARHPGPIIAAGIIAAGAVTALLLFKPIYAYSVRSLIPGHDRFTLLSSLGGGTFILIPYVVIGLIAGRMLYPLVSPITPIKFTAVLVLVAFPFHLWVMGFFFLYVALILRRHCPARSSVN